MIFTGKKSLGIAKILVTRELHILLPRKNLEHGIWSLQSVNKNC